MTDAHIKMVNAHVKNAAYVSEMRGVRHPEFSRYVQEQGLAERMRRLADFLTACVLLAITAPLVAAGGPLHHVGFIAGSGEHGYRTNVRSSIKRIRNKFRLIDPEFAEIENYPSFGYRWGRPKDPAP